MKGSSSQKIRRFILFYLLSHSTFNKLPFLVFVTCKVCAWMGVVVECLGCGEKTVPLVHCTFSVAKSTTFSFANSTIMQFLAFVNINNFLHYTLLLTTKEIFYRHCKQNNTLTGLIREGILRNTNTSANLVTNVSPVHTCVVNASQPWYATCPNRFGKNSNSL